MQLTKFYQITAIVLIFSCTLLAGCERERQSIEAPTDEAGLTVAPEKGMNDDLNLTTAVYTAIRAEQGLDNLNIQVEVDKGDVRLHGEVATRQQLELAESIAKAIPGVHTVNNDLEIN